MMKCGTVASLLSPGMSVKNLVLTRFEFASASEEILINVVVQAGRVTVAESVLCRRIIVFRADKNLADGIISAVVTVD